MSAETHLRVARATKDDVAAIASATGHTQADVVAACVAWGKAHPDKLRARLRAMPPAPRRLTDAEVEDIRKSGWSGADLAEFYGVDPGYITKIRKGERRLTKK